MAGMKMMGGGGPRAAQAPAKKGGQFQQRAPASTPQQDQTQAEALSSSLSDAGSALDEQGSAVEPQLPFTQHAADFKREEVIEGQRAADSEFPSESATLRSMGAAAEREMGEAKAARAAGDKRLEFIHMERACDLYNAASEKASALEILSDAARLLRGADAPAEMISALKGAIPLQRATPAGARAMMEFAKAASESLRSSPRDRIALGAMHARAFAALGRGNPSEAGLHRDLAGEVPKAGPRGRRKAEDASASLAKGRMSAAEVMALISMLRAGPSGAGIPPGEIRARILAMQAWAKSHPEREQELMGLLGPAQSYLAKAEDAKRIGDEAKAAEYLDLSLMHLEEAEAMMTEKPVPHATPAPVNQPEPTTPIPSPRAAPAPMPQPKPSLSIQVPSPRPALMAETPAPVPETQPPDSSPAGQEPLAPEIVALLSDDCCGHNADAILALSSKSGETLQALGELYSTHIKAAAEEIPDEGIRMPLALLSGFAEKMPSLENLKDARAAAFLAEFYLFAAKRGVPGKDEAGRMIIELADMVMSPEDALGRLSELAGVASPPAEPLPRPELPAQEKTPPAPTAIAPETPKSHSSRYSEFGTEEKFVSFAQKLLSGDPAVRAGAEASLAALGDDPAASVIRSMLSDMKSKKLYMAAVSRGDRFGIDRFVRFDVPKLAKEWLREFEKAAGIHPAP